MIALTFINQAHLSARSVRRAEAALVQQSKQVHKSWHTPVIQWVPHGGLKVTVKVTQPFEPQGWHSATFTNGTYGPAYAVVLTQGSFNWRIVLSHEVTEMIVDPHSNRKSSLGMIEEICDPVYRYSYRINGVPVSDFTLPAYWTHNQGPWDWTRKLTGPIISHTKGKSNG